MDTPHLICVTYYPLWFVMLPTTLHGRRPGLNKVRQRGVWGDNPPSGGLGAEPLLGKGDPGENRKLTPFCNF